MANGKTTHHHDQNRPPFWREKSLEQMSDAEWESLCDGCGRCCLVKLEDEDTGRIHATSVGCRLFDAQSCRCTDYADRASLVPDCVTLTPEAVRTLTWLPPSCAYRLLAEGKELYWWHPLVSGDPATVVEAGVSVKGRVSAMEDDVPLDELQEHLANWPLRMPRKARAVR
ncbi:MAG: YcgN family cysteine cluster protein [Bosea sp. (in: a-proteobacteria)]